MGKKKTDGRVTIVGGRPMHRGVDPGQLPQGVEQVLTLAGLDHQFRREVARDPVAAAASKGIALGQTEARLLRSTPPEQLAKMSERLAIPPSPGRRHFIKAVAASVVAMATGEAVVMLCSGCTGVDTWVPDSGGDGGPEQKWMELAGYTTYVYLPAAVVAAPSTAAPVLVALHGDDETCLSSVQRWHRTADQYGFSLIAVNWTEPTTTPGDLDEIVLAFGETYSVDAASVFLASRGASTPAVYRAAFVETGQVQWKAVAWLGGAPEGDWVNDGATLLQSVKTAPPALYHLFGTEDPDYAQAQACADALTGNAVLVRKEQLDGSTSDAVLDFSAIWQWLQNPV